MNEFVTKNVPEKEFNKYIKDYIDFFNYAIDDIKIYVYNLKNEKQKLSIKVQYNNKKYDLSRENIFRILEEESSLYGKFHSVYEINHALTKLHYEVYSEQEDKYYKVQYTPIIVDGSLAIPSSNTRTITSSNKLYSDLLNIFENYVDWEEHRFDEIEDNQDFLDINLDEYKLYKLSLKVKGNEYTKLTTASLFYYLQNKLDENEKVNNIKEALDKLNPIEICIIGITKDNETKIIIKDDVLLSDDIYELEDIIDYFIEREASLKKSISKEECR